NCHTLALSAGQPYAAVADGRVDSIDESLDDLFKLRVGDHAREPLFVDLRLRQPKADVGLYALVSQVDHLRDVPDQLLPGRTIRVKSLVTPSATGMWCRALANIVTIRFHAGMTRTAAAANSAMAETMAVAFEWETADRIMPAANAATTSTSRNNRGN